MKRKKKIASIAEIQALLKAGKTQQFIADQLGVSKQAVCNRIQRLNLKFKNPPGRKTKATKCPKCKTLCVSAREANGHCTGERKSA